MQVIITAYSVTGLTRLLRTVYLGIRECCMPGQLVFLGVVYLGIVFPSITPQANQPMAKIWQLCTLIATVESLYMVTIEVKMATFEENSSSYNFSLHFFFRK